MVKPPKRPPSSLEDRFANVNLAIHNSVRRAVGTQPCYRDTVPLFLVTSLEGQYHTWVADRDGKTILCLGRVNSLATVPALRQAAPLQTVPVIG